MKLFVFRCRGQHQAYAATRFETGSDLPAGRCAGGWEFVKVVNVSDSGTVGTDVRRELGVDVRSLRQGIKHQGWHVWESRREMGEAPVKASGPTTLPLAPAPTEASAPAAEPSAPAASAPALDASRPSLAAPPPAPAAPPPVPAAPAPAPPPPPRAPAASPPALDVPLPRAAAPARAPAAAAAPAAPGPSSRSLPAMSSGRPTPRPRPAPGAPAAPAPPPVERPYVSPPAADPAVRRLSGHRVVWFDIPVRDLDRAMRFYAAVLGTPLKKEYAGPAAAIVVLPHTDTTIGGCLVQSTDMEPGRSGPLLYLNTQGRLDVAVVAAQANGGTLLQPTHSIGPYGYRAILLDSEGNRIALHSM